jgi:hypothetical protein
MEKRREKLDDDDDAQKAKRRVMRETKGANE